MKMEMNDLFKSKSREFEVKPFTAARYEPGMENGWEVYYSGMAWEGRRYFDTYEEAEKFYNEHPQQKYINEDGNEGMCECEYLTPEPVLYTPRHTEDSRYVMDVECPFPSDESRKYNVLMLMGGNIWITRDCDGTINIWEPADAESMFVGSEFSCLVANANNYKNPECDAEWLKSKVG